MKKYLALAVIVLGAISFVHAATAQSTLWNYFVERKGFFPSLEERAIEYEQIFTGEKYRGTQEQNTKYLQFFSSRSSFGSLAPSTGPTAEATTTAGWTDDGSIVRLNTIADSVGIGTINPLEKLSVVGGNQYLSGTLSVAGTTFNLGSGTATSTFSSTSGRLGLGTTTPAQTFSVQGNALISGSVRSGDLTATGTVVLGASGSATLGQARLVVPNTDGSNGQFLQTNGSGTLSFSSVGTIQWVKLGQNINATASSSMSVSISTPRQIYHVNFYTPGTASDEVLQLRFNNDGGTNYGRTRIEDGAAIERAGSIAQCTTFGTSSTTATYLTFDVTSTSTVRKMLTFRGNQAQAGANAPRIIEGGCTWNNTSSGINIITVQTNGGANFNANSRLTVYGSDD